MRHFYFNRNFQRSAFISLLLVASFFILGLTEAQSHEGHHEHAIAKATGGDFTLASDKGAVSLSDFREKVVAIYFGYTHCEDICPLDLNKLGRALKAMKPEELAQIQPIFITVDPARDNAKLMSAYSATYYPGLIGLTGSEGDIAKVAKAYGVGYVKGAVNSTGGYDIDHPSDIFLVNKKGKLLQSLPQRTKANQITAALRKILAKN
jgi:protein SCO1/2